MAMKKRIDIEAENVIVDYDPLRKQETPKTGKDIAEAGLANYLSTRSADYDNFKSIAFNEETKALIDAVAELDKFNDRPAMKSAAYNLQRYLHVGMMLKLKAESDPELLEIFNDLFNKSKRARDRDI